MVCLGPRKKEKKANSNPDDTQTSRGMKKTPTSKLKNSKTSTSLAPSIGSTATAKKTTRTSLESTANKPRPPSRNSLLPTGRTPSPVHRSTSPHKSPANSRPSSIASVKSNNTVSSLRPSTASRTPSNMSNTKRFPIAEMKEEVKDLKAKVGAYIKMHIYYIE